MIVHYLKTAFRNLLHNKTQSAINTTGLLVGFSAFLLIFLVLQYEESFDVFHTKKDRIYRVVREAQDYSGGDASFPLAGALRKEFPQVEKAAAIYGDRNVQVIVPGENGSVLKKFKENNNVFFAEPDFFSLFDFRMPEGDPADAIREPNTALLTKEVAVRYFGDAQKAIGRIIRIYEHDIRITGILDNPPANTDLPLGIVASYSTYVSLGIDLNDWIQLSARHYCFVLLKPGHSATQFNNLLSGLIARHVPKENIDYHLSLQPLREMHFEGRFGNFREHTFSHELIATLRIIGIFLLLIACVNFINLSTAHAVTRSKEIGVRKVLGGSRKQLLWQFFGETGLVCLFSIAGAVLLTLCCLPFINRLLETSIPPAALWKPGTLTCLLLAWLVVTFLSGAYPALVLSGFNPISALKNKISSATGKTVSLRRSLVVCQFVIAQVLIIGTLVVVSQMRYFNNIDLGFNKEAIIHADFPWDSIGQVKMSALRNELLQQPGVKEISFSAFVPSGKTGWATDLWKNRVHSSKPDVIVIMRPADTGYFSLYHLQLLAGRIYHPADTMHEFVINETLLKKLDLRHPEDAIGRDITVSKTTGPIVGVIKDFHTRSLRHGLEPVVLSTVKSMYKTVNIKIAPDKAGSVIAAATSIWNKLFPNYVFGYNFMNETLAAYYKQEQQLAQLYLLFAGIAIFISCLGLYGLVSFMAVRKKKEIGIRKVLGAPVSNILLLLSGEFLLLIGIAFFIAAPVAWYFMHNWLQQYTYRIHLGAGIFLATLLSSVFIAWLTVGHSAIKAATANPVKSLRTE